MTRSQPVVVELRFCFVLLALPFIRGDWFQIITLTAAPAT